MSSKVSDLLAALGVRPADGDTTPMSPGDMIDEIMRTHFPWPSGGVKWHPTLVAQARDMKDTLETWARRIDDGLEGFGTELTSTLALPRTPSSTYFVMDGRKQHTLEQCKHRYVQVHESIAVLVCKSCKLPVNPIWWVATYAEDIKRSVAWSQSMREEKAKLRVEIDELKKERNKIRSAVNRQKKRDAR